MKEIEICSSPGVYSKYCLLVYHRFIRFLSNAHLFSISVATNSFLLFSFLLF